MSGGGTRRVVDHEAPTEELSWSAWVGHRPGDQGPRVSAISAETALARKRIEREVGSAKPRGRFQLRGH